MTDKVSDSLPYGHFGPAIYDAENDEWQFGRSNAPHGLLELVGQSNVIAESTPPSESASRSDDKDAPSTRREKQTRALIQALPEIQPASHLLPDLARTSEAIENAVSRYDARKGQLIALGQVYDESKRRYTGVIAFPCGSTGSNLCIIEGRKQRQGWGEDRTSWIETFDFAGEAAVWEGPGVAILSIIFAQPLEQGERYLAVRLHAETLVFRPFFMKHSSHGVSRLDPNFLFSVAVSQTGGVMHADFAFNPWLKEQVAIIDQAGHWSVWEIGRKSSGAKLIKYGSLADSARKKHARVIEDGLHRISWVANASTLCLASRQKLVLVDLEATDEPANVNVDIKLKEGREWIQDVCTLRTHLDLLFVLTASNIQIFRVAKTADDELLAKLTLQIRHHRNPDDTSLRMSLCSSNDGVTLVLRSALSRVTHQFFCDVSNIDNIRIQQPGEFDFPIQLQGRNVIDCQIDPLPWFKKDETFNTSTRTTRYHVYCLSRDLSLTQTLYGSRSGQGVDVQIQAPTWVADVSKPKKKSRAAFPNPSSSTADDSLTPMRSPMSNFVLKRRGSKTTRKGEEWTVSYVHVVQKLNNSDGAEQIEIEEVIEQTFSRLQTPSLQALPLTSLHELVSGNVRVADLSGASERLDRLRRIPTDGRIAKFEDDELEQNTQMQQHRVADIASPAASALLGLHNLSTLSQAFETLSNAWVVQDGRTLQPSLIACRSSLVRHLAAEVVLGSQVLRGAETRADEGQHAQGRRQEWDLSVRLPLNGGADSQDSKPSEYSGPSRSQTPALPTPSASASTITRSSHPSSFAAPEISRLSQYTTFTKHPPSALPRVLNKILSHWTVGSDPADYDWQSTARHVSRPDDEANEDGMTEKERHVIQKRAERYIRRQRREAEESQRMQMLSSQAPEIVTASHPGVRRAESHVSAGAAGVGSSQSHGMSQTTASQVVPGRHGGRPPAKKKRKSGF